MSAKYKMIYQPLIDRVYMEERGAKDPEKAAKTRLHRLFGAYVQVNTFKKAEKVLSDILSGQASYENLLKLHASTKERLPVINDFYEFIFNKVERTETILDLGCGFNPFAVSFMSADIFADIKSYHAYDIDRRTSEMLNRFFEFKGLPQNAGCADLITETPLEMVDLAFMFKVLPVLEAQSQGRGYELARNLNARFLVVTYPLKSLGGHEKGMESSYTAAFTNAVDTGLFGNYEPVSESRLGHELVFVLKNNNTLREMSLR